MGSHFIAQTAVPALVILLMAIVGTDLTPSDLRRVGQVPGVIVTAALAQLVVVPMVSAATVLVLHPSALLTVGLVLLAGCPAGAASNVYAYLAGANVALSVTLTAVSSVLAVGALPLVMSAGLRLLLTTPSGIEMSVPAIAQQLVILLLLPIGLGMAVRGRWPSWTVTHRAALRATGLAATVTLLGGVAWSESGLLLRTLGPTAEVALSFTLLTMVAGWLIGRAVSAAPADHFTLLIEFSTRNIAVATAVAVTLLGRPEFVVVATAFFVIQSSLALAAVAIFRARCTSGKVHRRLSHFR